MLATLEDKEQLGNKMPGCNETQRAAILTPAHCIFLNSLFTESWMHDSAGPVAQSARALVDAGRIQAYDKEEETP